ncbi:hypothetical protein DFH29DRAFT_849312 [Suillus ampliporus]|nr:hypothetical protein DFH29DRAFT_849312 [Suillus ampliporus]
MTVRLRSNLQKEMLLLMLNLSSYYAPESTGFVHGISLRFALASESRLRFNSNLRLLTAARGWSNPNGALLNGTMAVLLIYILQLSLTHHYSLPLRRVGCNRHPPTRILGLPLLLLGVALLLQVVIAWSGMRAVKILTWSSSSLDLTAALIHHTQLTPVPLRCMRAMSNMDVYEGPAKPSHTQPSAWHAHPSIRKIIISLWGLVVACAGWAALVTYFYNTYKSIHTSVITFKSWSFFPSDISVAYGMPLSGNGPWWILSLANVAVFQGPLTLGLHCSELITNVIRDERHWRCATGRKGLRSATNPLKSVFANPLCLILFIAKPALHWMFGLAFTSNTGDANTRRVSFLMYTTQIWNLCIALAIFASFFTLVSLSQPRGPQPAAYGHLQTLANLVDEWSPVMWWGHKEDRVPYCHAGRVFVRSQGWCIDVFKQGRVITRCRLSRWTMFMLAPVSGLIYLYQVLNPCLSGWRCMGGVHRHCDSRVVCRVGSRGQGCWHILLSTFLGSACAKE